MCVFLLHRYVLSLFKLLYFALFNSEVVDSADKMINDSFEHEVADLLAVLLCDYGMDTEVQQQQELDRQVQLLNDFDPLLSQLENKQRREQQQQQQLQNNNLNTSLVVNTTATANDGNNNNANTNANGYDNPSSAKINCQLAATS